MISFVFFQSGIWSLCSSVKPKWIKKWNVRKILYKNYGFENFWRKSLEILFWGGSLPHLATSTAWHFKEGSLRLWEDLKKVFWTFRWLGYFEYSVVEKKSGLSFWSEFSLLFISAIHYFGGHAATFATKSCLKLTSPAVWSEYDLPLINRIRE